MHPVTRLRPIERLTNASISPENGRSPSSPQVSSHDSPISFTTSRNTIVSKEGDDNSKLEHAEKNDEMAPLSSHHNRDQQGRVAPRLDTLPTEILAIILDHFALELPPYSSPTPLLHDRDRKHNLNKWEGKYFARLRTLRDLRLVSWAICHAATVALFRVVIIRTRREFVLFLRSLLESPHNGVHIRQLAIFVTLNDESVGRGIVKKINEDLKLGTFKGEKAQQTKAMRFFLQKLKFMDADIKRPDGRGRYYAAEVSELALFSILRATPFLDVLALQVPLYTAAQHRWTGSKAGGRQFRPLWEILDTFKSEAAESEADGSHRADVSVRELQLRPDYTEHVRCENEHRSHEARAGMFSQTDILNYRLGLHRLLLDALPSLRSLKLASCSEISLIGASSAGHIHRNIEDLHLHNTSEGPMGIAALLERTPSLRSLHVRQRPKHKFDAETLNDRGLEMEGKELNLSKALTMHADSLRELHLIFDYTFEYQYFVGPGQRLGSLPLLHRLEKLTIQLQLLFGHPRRLDPDPDLSELLPPNLVELTIRDDWAIDAIAREQRHRAQLIYNMDSEIEFVDGVFPNAVLDQEYYCSFEHYKPYRNKVQNMLIRLAGTCRHGRLDADGRVDGFHRLKSVTFQVLPGKVYRMSSISGGRLPAIQPMEEDLFKDPRRGFFTDPPRWMPLLGKDMWPKEHWELMETIGPFFTEVASAFQDVGIDFDWQGDAKVWLAALKAAAATDDGSKVEVSTLEFAKEDEDDEVDGDDGDGADVEGGQRQVNLNRLARLTGRLKKLKRPRRGS